MHREKKHHSPFRSSAGVAVALSLALGGCDQPTAAETIALDPRLARADVIRELDRVATILAAGENRFPTAGPDADQVERLTTILAATEQELVGTPEFQDALRRAVADVHALSSRDRMDEASQ